MIFGSLTFKCGIFFLRKKGKWSEQAGFFTSLLTMHVNNLICIYNFTEIKVWDDPCWSTRRKLKLHNKCDKVHYKTTGTKKV